MVKYILKSDHVVMVVELRVCSIVICRETYNTFLWCKIISKSENSIYKILLGARLTCTLSSTTVSTRSLSLMTIKRLRMDKMVQYRNIIKILKNKPQFYGIKSSLFVKDILFLLMTRLGTSWSSVRALSGWCQWGLLTTKFFSSWSSTICSGHNWPTICTLW